jgi:hypothetical protein
MRKSMLLPVSGLRCTWHCSPGEALPGPFAVAAIQPLNQKLLESEVSEQATRDTPRVCFDVPWQRPNTDNLVGRQT